jgi:hypothetical protein
MKVILLIPPSIMQTRTTFSPDPSDAGRHPKADAVGLSSERMERVFERAGDAKGSRWSCSGEKQLKSVAHAGSPQGGL